MHANAEEHGIFTGREGSLEAMPVPMPITQPSWLSSASHLASTLTASIAERCARHCSEGWQPAEAALFLQTACALCA